MSQITSDLKTPLGIGYCNGVVYLTEGSSGGIRVLDLQGKYIYNPDKLMVKDLKKILKRHGAQVLPGPLIKDTFKKSLVCWLEREGDQGFREKQKHIQAINFSKPGALHVDKDGKMFVSDKRNSVI